jgi:HD-GYP domain-containing protein (c-di-GMP phosphodiesterase class II)
MERVKDNDIIVGSPIPWDAYDEKGELLLREGDVMESETELNALIEIGLFHIKTQADVETTYAIESSTSPFEMLEGVQKILSRLFNRVPAELTSNFPSTILNLGRTIQQACDQDMDASLGVILMNRSHPYTISHPVNAAIICETVTRHLQWEEDDRLSLLAATLTANIAMIELQEKLYSQKEPLSTEQRHQINQHPEQGVEILQKSGVTNKMWLDIVHFHHEAIDGSGYPSGLRRSAIPIGSQILAVADHYCAGVSHRKYRAALSPNDAMLEIYLSSGKRVEPKIMNLCVKLIGVYPPGSFVRLANNEIAVVTHRGQKTNVPIVHSLVRADGTLFSTPQGRDCSQEEFAVKDLILSDQDKVDIDPNELWGYREMLTR